MSFRRSLPSLVCAFSLLFGLLPAGVAAAQDKKAKPDEAKPAAEDIVKPTNAAYMKPLGRLATILGSMHFLRGLCGMPMPSSGARRWTTS